jgi:hypothetical protein
MTHKPDGEITDTEKWIFGGIFFCLSALALGQYTDHATLSGQAATLKAHTTLLQNIEETVNLIHEGSFISNPSTTSVSISSTSSDYSIPPNIKTFAGTTPKL